MWRIFLESRGIWIPEEPIGTQRNIEKIGQISTIAKESLAITNNPKEYITVYEYQIILKQILAIPKSPTIIKNIN